MTIAIQQLSSVEKAETVQVYFTLEGEDPKAQKNFMDEKSTWTLIWHIIDHGLWSLGIHVRPTSKR